jgi:acyl-coenzyme A synthetase/AMP-(fatty) acid ligase
VGHEQPRPPEDGVALERGEGFKAPRTVVTVEELPRNATGKVLKHQLRQQFPGPAPE